MALAKGMLIELGIEMANTRKTLLRVPDDRLEWSPHEKSMTFAGLATHIANIPRYGVYALEQQRYDVAPVGEDPPRMEAIASAAESVERLDENVSDLRARLETADDGHMMAMWTLLSGGKPVFTLPRVAVLRMMVLSHIIHHRAQLALYLRMNDLPMPSLYGPSADEAS